MRLVRSQAFVCLGVASLILVGCAGKSSSTTATTAAPVVSFTAPSGTVTAGQVVSFTDTSTGSPTTWSWTFGDGGTSAIQNPTHTFATAGTFTVSLTASNAGGSAKASKVLTISSATGAFAIVDTGQSKCFDATAVIAAPSAGAAFYGQDAQFSGTQASYTKSTDGLTVRDNATGLTWQKSPDTNGDGVIDSLDKMTLAEARARPTALNAARYGGYTDWRLPTIKELYSIINFSGTDPSGATGNDTSGLKPFLDRAYFDFGYGDTARGERIIDMQYASSTLYVSTTMLGSPTMFGVNFADGRIKGYTLDMSYQGPGDARFPVRLVRGAAYGENDFADNGDGTLSDRASGLMWTKGDSATGMNWQEALAWVQLRNAANHLGHSDWRLPNAKELQNIVDYGRSPDTTASAAISPLFTCTGITNEAGKADFPFYWTGTTHESQGGGPGGITGGSAVYIAFGRAMGYMTDPSNPSIGAWLDVHGAGAQRSDPKVGNPADFPKGRGPQGDAIRIYNYVRLVRDAK
jgi:PKD repeat protein